jgi:hypothetical protein
MHDIEKGELGFAKLNDKNIQILYHRQAQNDLYHSLSMQFFQSQNKDDAFNNFCNRQDIKELKDSYIRTSGMAIQLFNAIGLFDWYLWSFNEYGELATEEKLSRYITGETYPVMVAEWVLGVEVDEVIELSDGIKIVPIEQMPFSRDKVEFSSSFGKMPDLQTKVLYPQAAIVKIVDIPQFKSKNSKDMYQPTPDILKLAMRAVSNLSILLNAVNGVSCLSYMSTSYPHDGMPLAHLGGGSSSESIYDVYGECVSKITASMVKKINELYDAFVEIKSEDNRILAKRALSRLCQAKRRHAYSDDRLLDLGIVLEMLLLPNNKNANQLSLSCALRGAWLIGETGQERLNWSKKIKELYTSRSSLAHTGILDKKTVKAQQEDSSYVDSYIEIVEKVFSKILLLKMDVQETYWEQLLVGGVHENTP